MLSFGEVIRIETSNSSAVEEVTFVSPNKIYVVPRNGDTVYVYDGHKELFETVAYSSSVGRAWGDYLRIPLQAKGEEATRLSFGEYLSALTPQEPIEITYQLPSSHAW